MFVGEQPGDQEDLAGKPFVGPAGQMFDRALGEAGLDRSRAYVTNAVKHFKFTLRGKRRIHEKPNAGEVKACRFWLGLERQFVATYTLPPLTTVHQPGYELGRLAAAAMLQLLAGQKPTIEMPPPRLVARESTARPRR